MTGFDPDAYLAAKSSSPAGGGFDPDAYLAKKSAPKPGISPWTSRARGALQGVTHEFSDEAQAGMATGLQALTNILPESLRDRFDLVQASEGDAYRETRDMDRADNKAAQEAHPDDYAAGQVAGTVAGAFLPVGKAAKGLKGAVKVGAMLGGAAGLGGSEADLLKGEVGEAALDTGLGALAGTIGGAVGHGITRGIGRVTGGVRDFVARRLAPEAAEAAAPAVARATQTTPGGVTLEEARRAVVSLEKEIAGKAKRGASDATLSWKRELLEAARKRAASLEALPESARPAETAARTGAAGLVDKMLKEYAVPAAAGWAVSKMGGDDPVSRVVQFGIGAAAGKRGGSMAAKLLQDPRIRQAGWRTVQAIAGKPESQALGRFAPLLSRAAAKGEGELKLLHAALLEKAPEYAAALARMVSGEEEAEPVAAAQ